MSGMGSTLQLNNPTSWPPSHEDRRSCVAIPYGSSG